MVLGEDPNNTAHVRSGGYTKVIAASKTRPANTTAYAVGDVINESTSIGTVITFVNAGRTIGNSGIINSAQVVDSANQATPPGLVLWLFDAAPATVNDNAAFDPSDADLEDKLIGTITLDENLIGDDTSAAAGNYVLQAKNENLAFECAAASRDIYGILQVTNAYVPVSAEKFTIKLGIFQD